MLTKICTKCREERPLDAFYNRTKSSDGKDSRCRMCAQAINAAQYLAHADERRTHSRTWQRNNPEKLTAYRLANAAKIREQKTLCSALWRKAHPKEKAQQQSRRRARHRALPSTWTATQRQFMLAYWHYACAICGNEEGLLWTLAYDHFIPLASPDCPGTVAENMLPLCHTNRNTSIRIPCCNNSKSGKDPHAWLVAQYGARKAAKIERAIAVYFALARQQA